MQRRFLSFATNSHKNGPTLYFYFHEVRIFFRTYFLRTQYADFGREFMKKKKTIWLILSGIFLCLLAGLVWQWDLVERTLIDRAQGNIANPTDPDLKTPLRTVGVVRPTP